MKQINIAVLLFAIVFSAKAATLSVNCTSVSVNISSAAPQPAEPMLCPQFNPALGVLKGAALIAEIYPPLAGGTLTIRNDTGGVFDTPALILQEVTFTATFPGGFVQTVRAPLEVIPPNFTAMAIGETRTFVARSASFGEVFTGGLVTASTLAPLIGNGTISSVFGPVTAGSPTGVTPTPGLTYLGWTASFNNYSYVIRYEYDSIPEPSAALLAGLGLTALLSRKLRRP